MSDDTYQGHKNRETWALLLWVANDQGLYEQAVDFPRDWIADNDAEEVSAWHNEQLGIAYLEQTRSEWDDYMLEGGASREFLGMIEDIGSWWRIDAREVGEFLREAVECES